MSKSLTPNAKIGLVGLGGVARAQISAIRGCASADIVAVCDINGALAADIAAELSARAFTDAATMFDQLQLDLAIVMTPASTHRAVVEAAAEAGTNILCEKPIATTLADGEAMVAACNAAGVTFFYGSSYRWLPAVRAARNLVKAGAIGSIFLMTETVIGGNGLDGYRQYGPAHYPHGQPGGPGMGLIDHGIHLIDIFCWIIDAAPERVYGKVQISGEPPVTEWLHMEFPCGAAGHLLYNAATLPAATPYEGVFSGGQGWLADGTISTVGTWEKQPGSFAIHGSSGSLRVFHYANDLILTDHNGIKRIPLEGRPAFGHFATQLESCITALRAKAPAPVSGLDAMRALRVALAPSTMGGVS
jgi:UDP-N-acetyl-2-amino-2-deoxyglucuronate dehydrogenase